MNHWQGAWPKLDQIADHGVSFGGVRIAADLMAVDSGYNADAVYQWVRRRHNAIAVKGDDGWSKPAISRSKEAEVRTHGLSAGKAKRYGIRVWMIGTWSIKATLILFLGKLPKEGGGGLPTGYQHFAADTEESYFQHLTSEFIKTVENDGAQRREFGQRGPNHWLDCWVYGYALTHFGGLWSWSEEQWDARARELSLMTKPAQDDMFGAAGTTIAAAIPLPPDDETETPALPVKPKRQSDGLDALSRLNQ
jgi:phage terminase large subunit GpA-like protein